MPPSSIASSHSFRNLVAYCSSFSIAYFVISAPVFRAAHGRHERANRDLAIQRRVEELDARITKSIFYCDDGLLRRRKESRQPPLHVLRCGISLRRKYSDDIAAAQDDHRMVVFPYFFICLIIKK